MSIYVALLWCSKCGKVTCTTLQSTNSIVISYNYCNRLSYNVDIQDVAHLLQKYERFICSQMHYYSLEAFTKVSTVGRLL